MRPRKQSSSTLSSVAARVMLECKSEKSQGYIRAWLNLDDVMRVCASVISQDEVKGQAPRKRIVKRNIKKKRVRRAK